MLALRLWDAQGWGPEAPTGMFLERTISGTLLAREVTVVVRGALLGLQISALSLPYLPAIWALGAVGSGRQQQAVGSGLGGSRA